MLDDADVFTDAAILEALAAGGLLPACLQGATPATGQVSLDGSGKSAVVVQYALPSRDTTGHRCACCAGLGHVAVRVFRSATSRATEYRLIEEHIRQVRMPSSFVTARYHDAGLRMRRDVLPVVVMEWVADVPLGMFIEDHRKDRGALCALAASWAAVIHDLESRKIAHGDLQPDNIFVAYAADGPLVRLVDYDSVVVPEMSGNVESIFGVAGFSHPRRRELGRKVLHADVLPALVIYASLLLLADDSDLWEAYGDDTLLLFREADFTCFASEKMRALRTLRPGLLDAIQRICEAPPEKECRFSDEVPLLPEEPADGQARQPMLFAPAPTRPPAPSGPSRRPSSPIPSQVVPSPQRPPSSPAEVPLTFGLSPVADISPDEAPWFTPPGPVAAPVSGDQSQSLSTAEGSPDSGSGFAAAFKEGYAAFKEGYDSTTRGSPALAAFKESYDRSYATLVSIVGPRVAWVVIVVWTLVFWGAVFGFVFGGGVFAFFEHTYTETKAGVDSLSTSAPPAGSVAPIAEPRSEPAVELVVERASAAPGAPITLAPRTGSGSAPAAELTVASPPVSPDILVAGTSSGSGVLETKPWQICSHKNRPAAEPGVMEFYGCEGYDPEARWRCEVAPTPDRPTLTVTSCTAPQSQPAIGTP